MYILHVAIVFLEATSVAISTIENFDEIPNISKVSPTSKFSLKTVETFSVHRIFNHEIPWASSKPQIFLAFTRYCKKTLHPFFLHRRITLTPKNIPPCTKALNKMRAVRNFLCDFSPVDFINKMNINYSIFHLRSHVLKPETHSLAAAFSSLTLFFLICTKLCHGREKGGSIKLRLCITYRHFLLSL